MKKMTEIISYVFGKDKIKNSSVIIISIFDIRIKIYYKF